jgi:hypothetical protein
MIGTFLRGRCDSVLKVYVATHPSGAGVGSEGGTARLHGAMTWQKHECDRCEWFVNMHRPS